jgi:transketolase
MNSMLNPDLKLNPKIFDTDVEQLPIRKGFGEGLLAAGETDKQVVGLCADLWVGVGVSAVRSAGYRR